MKKLESVQDLMAVAADLPSDDYVGGWFYRGQADASWDLEPKAHRFPHNVGDKFEFKFKMWLKQAYKYPGMDFENELEAMAIAQHHGFATKLLDWSSNILTSAFFACSSNFDKDGKIYAYFPTQYAYLEKDVLVPGGEPKNVVGYQPKGLAARLQAQSGYFTYHKQPEFKIENKFFEPGKHDTLFEWTIPAEAKLSIILMLDRLSVNYKTLFPDLDGLSKHHCLMDEVKALQKTR
ncbi:FRG domain-containing protein [Vibrio vulnificus]|uniref:FRG domain-containing protein n=1 Tax=Vibrio vulnificus TaxID=672 RepID=UPI0028790AD4|nr:FRG domain-containing protein [Vibrio vulnificus]MDS1842195.1 FRG domain-containing protein [Vibrio vulnificus]MDS1850845.1 FRG domain-containing protein [Vibrio vulnificus]